MRVLQEIAHIAALCLCVEGLSLVNTQTHYMPWPGADDESSVEVSGEPDSDAKNHPGSTNGEEVAWNDRSSADQNDLPILSAGAYDFNFWSMCGARYDSNLAGLGPDLDSESSLRYKNIGWGLDSDGQRIKVDLVVTVNSSYSSNDVTRNGLVSKESCFGVVNVAASSAVDLLFSLYRKGTNESVAFEKLFFTVYDMDGSQGNKAQEAVTFYSSVRHVHYVTPNDMDITGDLATGLTFTATQSGGGQDNPQDPSQLTPQQKRRTVMVELVNTTQWKITFAVIGTGGGGRNFGFGGKAKLFVDPPTLAPTTSTTTPPDTTAPTSTTLPAKTTTISKFGCTIPTSTGPAAANATTSSTPPPKTTTTATGRILPPVTIQPSTTPRLTAS